ncbi:replication stress response regulator SDE2 [Teleopsis dalmanni]|uniref:replication stress response regulator SDE2 n=1 Tax=Teleopsis dalmanni TaxID=139649 RepID=UPI0018CFE3D1|nr:replication stress response regulator SDE2 [Teleopsis dalmanni]
MGKVLLNNIEICQKDFKNIKQIEECIADCLALHWNEYFLIQNGKKLCNDDILSEGNIHCQLRLLGGKGGFGSMLRAIGAQIEKTTNREACRDLSGRRLRDINEEKRLKAWLEKQGEREREAEERKKRKVEKLLSVPKHEFKDECYEKTRATMTDKVNDAVEEGLKKAHEQQNVDTEKVPIKRKVNTTTTKNKKSALWIGDDISSSDSTSEDEDTVPEKKQKLST